MAWTVTSRGTVQTLNSAANTVIPSFTPGASKLLIAWFAGVAAPSAVSGQATWSLIGSAQAWDSGNQSTLRIYAGKSSGSPTGGTVTFTHAGNWYRCAGCVEIDENVVGVPSLVASCFGTPVGVAQYLDGSNPHAIGVTLGAFADSGNLTLIIGAGNTSGAMSFSAKSGFTSSQSVGTAEVQAVAHYLASADTAPNVVTNVNFVNVAALAVEVKKATGGTNAPQRRRRQRIFGTGFNP